MPAIALHPRAFGLRAAAIAATLALAVAHAQPQDREQRETQRLMEELASGKEAVGSDFELHDPAGRKRRLTDFRGKVVAIYFGYTFCPDVCPTGLLEIARALRSLGKRANDIQVLFITLDPARDTPALLGRYTRAFHPRILALRGSEAETQRIARAFKVYYERVDTPGSPYYVINHTAFTFLLDRHGRYNDFIPPGTPAGRIAFMLEELAASGK